jgi:hypothetical protein
LRHRLTAIACALTTGAAVSLLLTGGALSAPREPTAATGAAAITPAQAVALGTEAYLYGFPLTEFERTARIETSVRCPDAHGNAPLNTFSTATQFANPTARVVVAPNVDTLYSIAHLDLAKGPVVLSHPAMGKRYLVFELVDPYTDVIGYIGSRTTGAGGGRFAITWTGHRGSAVRGARVISSHYRYVWVIGRTLAGDRADQRKALTLMRQYTLTPPGGTLKFAAHCRPGQPISAKPATGLAFLDELGAALKRSPPPAADRRVLARLRSVGVGPGLTPQQAGLSSAALDALVSALDQEAKALPVQAKQQVFAQAVKHGGWYMPPADIGAYGADYKGRAEVASVGLGANTPAEAIYPVALADSAGALLDGSKTSYRLTFKRGQLPPARAFWSLTMYSESGFLVANSAHRYAIGSSHPPLRRQPNGDVVVALSHTRPSQRDVNWLPAPAALFRLNLRLYWPRRSARAGRWQPPPIIRLDSRP